MGHVLLIDVPYFLFLPQMIVELHRDREDDWKNDTNGREKLNMQLVCVEREREGES